MASGNDRNRVMALAGLVTEGSHIEPVGASNQSGPPHQRRERDGSSPLKHSTVECAPTSYG